MSAVPRIIEAPNYTQIPNVVFDEWMNKLSGGAFKVLMCICRKTFGWHKTSDSISKNQLMQVTGLSKNAVQSAIEELEKFNLIQKFQYKFACMHQPNTYVLSIDKPEDEIYNDEGVGQKLVGGRSKIDPGVGQKLTGGVGQKLTPQKKDYTKERLTKENISSTVVDKPSADASGLTSFFIEKIKQQKPDFKEPNATTWSKIFDQMLRLDKRDPEQIKRVIEWATNDSFWKANVLSPKKLREKFDQLELQMQSKNTRVAPQNISKSNQAFAHKVQMKFGTRKDITFGYNYLEFDNVRSVEQIKFDENGFTERAIAQLKRRNLSLEGIV